MRIWHQSMGSVQMNGARDLAAEYGVADRVVALSALGDDMDEWVIQHAWNEPDEIVARFTGLAEQAIAQGADVIIPVEGIITEFFYANGVTRIKDAPVLDTFGLAWKYAEFLVNLRNKTGLTVSRQWEYRKASDAQTARIRAALGLDAS